MKRLLTTVLACIVFLSMFQYAALAKSDAFKRAAGCQSNSEKTAAAPALAVVSETDYTKEIREYIQNNKYKIGVTSIETQDGSYIIAAMGEKMTGGYYAELYASAEGSVQVVADVFYHSPDPGSFVTQAVTYPVLVLKRNTLKEVKIRISEDEGKTYSKEYAFPAVQEPGYPDELEKFIEQNKTEEDILAVTVDGKQYIVVFMGMMPTGGYSLEVREIRENRTIRFVDIVFKNPENGQNVTKAITYPHIVIESAANKKIKIKVKDSIRNRTLLTKMIK